MSLSPILGIMVFLFFLAGALGLGVAAARPLRDGLPGGLFLSAAYALGTGILSIVFFFLCLAGRMNFSFAYAVVLAGCALFVWNFRMIAGAAAGVAAAAFGAGASRLTKICAAAGAAFVLCGVVMALAPPVDFDALTYHLTLPKLYASSSGFVSTPSIVYSHFPLGGEMLYTFAFVSGSPVAAALIHLSFGVFAALAAASFGGRFSSGPVNVGAPAALIFLSTPLAVWELKSSYVDLCMCLYLFAAFSLLLSMPKRAAFVAAAGACAGFAVAVKLTSGPYAVILLAFMIFLYKDRLPKRAAAAVLFCALCAAPALPWLVRTFFETGNPVFPFGYKLLGGRYWNPGVDKEFLFWHFGYGAGRGLLALLKLPYNLTFQASGNFGWNIPQLDRGLGFVFLAFIPILFVPGRTLKNQGAVLAFCLLSLAAWFLGTQQLRFLMAFFPALCLLYAAKTVNLSSRFPAAGNYIAVALTALICVNSWYQIGNLRSALGALAGGEAAREKYIAERVPAAKAFRALDGIALDVQSGKAGLIMENRSLYSSAPAVWLTPTQQGVVDYGAIPDAAALLKELRRLDVRYLLINRGVFERLYAKVDTDRREGRKYSKYFYRFFVLFHELLTSRAAKPVYTDDKFSIFRIEDEIPAADTPKGNTGNN